MRFARAIKDHLPAQSHGELRGKVTLVGVASYLLT